MFELGEQLAAFAFMVVEALADAAAVFAGGVRVAVVLGFVEFLQEPLFAAFGGLDVLAELFGPLSVVVAGGGDCGGQLGAEVFGTAGAEEVFAEEPVDRAQKDLLADPQSFGMLGEPVGVAVVDVVAVADVVGQALAGLAVYAAPAQRAAHIGAQGVGALGGGVDVGLGAAARALPGSLVAPDEVEDLAGDQGLVDRAG
ncbi:hypothetical protein [Streptomyces sp. NPDC003077]|uniref:hypothetical protein n=1 Tax=Streptomyces sp. NPDC003077 TaxID=3154443 RepID=UPI0033AE3EF4